MTQSSAAMLDLPPSYTPTHENLDYHPHIHVIVPAASINRITLLWRVKSGKYLFNHTALAQVFRAKVLHGLRQENLCPPHNNPQQWVVDCKHVGTGEKALAYLGRYLYRGVIREQDILHYTDATVTYRYFHAKTKKYRTKTVAGEQFLALLMRHVLPKGFRRTRDYGFLHPCSKKADQVSPTGAAGAGLQAAADSQKTAANIVPPAAEPR
ncbi:MAG: transposase [Desulfofustis sp. PB-SRB1]|nr:transposase [Desulfofustis sp. PB-SRB1]